MQLGIIKNVISWKDWDSLPKHIRDELIQLDYDNVIVTAKEASNYLEKIRHEHFR
jgi:hypothetical protein